MFDYKNLKNKAQNHAQPSPNLLLHLLYPVLLIIFTLLTVFFFLLGKNGFYAHKEKLSKIEDLQRENAQLYAQVANLRTRNHQLASFHEFTLEEEARKISLKKPGDVLIHLPEKQWIDSMAELYEPVKYAHEEVRTLFLFEHKVFLSFLAILCLAGVSVFFLSGKDRRL